MDKLSFWFVRGKDNLNIKIMAGKQLLSQAVEGCRFNAVFDKDFSTSTANQRYIDTDIKGRLGNNCVVHTHNGYCIESVLFSNPDLLKLYLDKLVLYASVHPINGLTQNLALDIQQFIQEFSNKKQADIRDVSSEFYKDMKKRFISQKKLQRPELDSIDFDTFADEAHAAVQYLMNKRNMAEFVLQLEERIGGRLFDRDDDEDETLSSSLLMNYFSSIEADDDIIPDFISLINDLRISPNS